MAALFPEIPEALSNNVEIAERCNVSIKAKPQLPVPEVPVVSNPEEYLGLCQNGTKGKIFGDYTCIGGTAQL